ncbi:transmembrane protein 81 [Protopterus annectens]|uniref:transmembrane protein 81 n=1 Tax=Protopterus annectens TaxID=7888 RepID=UPI001CFB010F|nr:transmembrane protein 81 [Protopterus annectens]
MTVVPNISIPSELMEVTAFMVVSSSECSVTCGLGFKETKQCLVLPSGEEKNCHIKRVECLSEFVCGLDTFTYPVKAKTELNCVNWEMASSGEHNYLCTWKFAKAMITTEDKLFIPFSSNCTLVFSHTEESDSGTYRCDVQLISGFKLIKRQYFGLRIIPSNLIDLGHDRFLSLLKKAEKNESNSSLITAPSSTATASLPWHENKSVLVGIGMGGGVLCAMFIGWLLRHMYNQQETKVGLSKGPPKKLNRRGTIICNT